VKRVLVRSARWFQRFDESALRTRTKVRVLVRNATEARLPSIDLSSVTHSDYQDDQLFVVDRVQDAVVANSQAIDAVVAALKDLDIRWPRIGGQRLEFGDDAPLRLPIEALQCLQRSGRESNRVRHAAVLA